MKVIAIFPDLYERRVGSKLLLAIEKIVPEAARRNKWSFSLDIMLPTDDPRFERVKQALKEFGYAPQMDRFRHRGELEYALQLHRHYELADFDGVSLFRIRLHIEFPSLDRGEDGRLRLETTKGRIRLDSAERVTKARIGIGSGRWIFVSDDLRQSMERAQLRHVGFRPTVMENGKKQIVPWPDEASTYWELTSDFILPPADWAWLRQENGELYAGDVKGGCYPAEGLYVPAELHYRKSSLAGMEPFDLAFTHEPHGPGRAPERVLVCSGRFREFCMAQKLKMDWIPVRIDD